MRQTVLGLFPTLEPSTKRMSASRMSRKGAIVFLVVTNLLAIPLFLYFSSQFWPPPGEEGRWEGPGDALLWMSLAFPWLAAGAFANMVVIPRISTELFYRKDLRLLLIWCACLLTFFSAYVYNGFRQPDDYLAPADNSARVQQVMGQKNEGVPPTRSMRFRAP
jgi:hypothetical protein